MLHFGERAAGAFPALCSNPDLGIGVAFTSVEAEDERILGWWIAECQGIPFQKPSVGS